MIHNDHLGTPQKLTDSTGTVVWSADYKPFGEATITVSTITNNLRFPGQYYDTETGLLYNLKRDYNQMIGRYIQADPIGQRGGLNLYDYGLNNPLINIDPLGECPETVFFGGFSETLYDVVKKGKEIQYTNYFQKSWSYTGNLTSSSGKCDCKTKQLTCNYDLWKTVQTQYGKQYPGKDIVWGKLKTDPAYLQSKLVVGWDCEKEAFTGPSQLTKLQW